MRLLSFGKINYKQTDMSGFCEQNVELIPLQSKNEVLTGHINAPIPPIPSFLIGGIFNALDATLCFAAYETSVLANLISAKAV